MKMRLRNILIFLITLSLYCYIVGLQFAGADRKVPGDFTGDGYTDILSHNTISGKNLIWSVNQWKSPEEIKIQDTGPNGYFVGQGDFNLDGTADLLTYNASQNVYVFWIMKKGIRQSWAVLNHAMPAKSRIAVIGDFVGTSHPDIVVRHGNGQLDILELKETEVHRIHKNVMTVNPLARIVAGDFLGSPKVELLVRTMEGARLLSFNDRQEIPAGSALSPKAKILDVADFYDSGKMAVLVRQKNGVDLEIWSFDKNGVLNQTSTVDLSSRLEQFQQTGFFDASPYPGILVKNVTTGTTTIISLNKGKVLAKNRTKIQFARQVIAVRIGLAVQESHESRAPDCQFDSKLYGIVDTDLACQADVDRLILHQFYFSTGHFTP
jgi:hypothetical protein